MNEDTVDCSEEKCDAQAEFERIAVELGLMQAGDPMDPALLDYGFRIAELCATIAERYSSDHGNAGEHIRARYGA